MTQHYRFMPGLKFMERQSENMSQQIGEEVATNLKALRAKLEDEMTGVRTF